jgi:solute carrier family 15 (peptide/histidine transporter), member 3/4
MLYTVTQIEKTNQMTKMLPVLITTCIPSTIISQTTTLFIRQGTTLDRGMGAHFKIPPACLIAFVNIFMLISVVIYDRVFVPLI